MKIRVVSVNETIDKLKEKNPSPRKVYNKAELTQIVEAVLSDKDYVAQNTKIKKGEFIKEDRHLSKEFKKALAEILKQLGLNSSEALAAVEEYKVPKSLAAVMVDAVHHADFLYMDKIGKAVKFHGSGDVDQTFFMRDFDERVRRSHVPNQKDGEGKPVVKDVKFKKHRKIATKSRYNPTIKDLLN
jgi:sulfur carrier protein ThiS